MVDIEFKRVLENLSIENWNRIFNLITEIEHAQSFGTIAESKEIEPGINQFPFWDWSEVTQKLVETLYDLKLIIGFDWSNWSEGQEILEIPEYDFGILDSV